MKMQEVIARLRELAPVAADNTSFAETLMCELVGVLGDLANATTLTASKAVATVALKQAKIVQGSVVAATKAAKELQDLNASYKEKLGPKAKRPKDDPRQQDLPGFEPSPVSLADNASARIAGGRHG